MADRSVLRRSEFYSDFLVPQKLLDCIGAVLLLENGRTAIVTALRSNRAAEYGEQELRVTRVLVPHLQAAIRINSHLSSLGHQRALLKGVGVGFSSRHHPIVSRWSSEQMGN